MKRVIFCMVMSLLFAFPVSGKTAIFKNDMTPWVKSSDLKDREIEMQFSENGSTEDDPATDDGEDLRDGDSDSNSNDDSDKDNG